jgi:hypothetical protein
VVVSGTSGLDIVTFLLGTAITVVWGVCVLAAVSGTSGLDVVTFLLGTAITVVWGVCVLAVFFAPKGRQFDSKSRSRR